MSKRQTWIVMLGLAVLIHWGILLLFTLEVIPQTTKNSLYTYVFHHGGDERGYWAHLQSLNNGTFAPNKFPLGYSITLVPLQWIVQANEIRDLIEPAALLWSVVIFPLMLLPLGWLAKQWSGRDSVGWLTIHIMALMPLISLLIFNLIWNAEMAEIIAIHQTWAQMLSDGPAAFFTVLAVALYWHLRRVNYAWYWIVVLGIILGLLAMIRYSAGMIAIVIGIAFLMEHRIWQAALLTLVSIIAFTPQALYNLAFFGGILTTGYTVLDGLPSYGLFNWRYLSEAIVKMWGYLGLFLPAAVIIGSGLVGWGLQLIWRHSRLGFWLVAGWLVSYLLFYGVYYYSWTGAFMRFMIPVLPIAALVLALVLYQIGHALHSILQNRKRSTI